MTFQTFFFDTYPGYFLQVLPIALAAGVLTLRHRRRAAPTGEKPRRQALWFFFSCYLAGLLALTLLPRGLLTELWHRLFYGRGSGAALLPAGGWNFIPDFWRRLRRENLGNLLMFLPFGVLYPLCRPERRWRDAALRGLCLSLGIELLQPFLGRSFDVNDLLLNALGAALGAGAVFLARRLPPAKRR